MEKMDLLLMAMAIIVLIFSLYICQLKAQIKYIMAILNMHREIIHGCINSLETQDKINNEFKKAIKSDN